MTEALTGHLLPREERHPHRAIRANRCRCCAGRSAPELTGCRRGRPSAGSPSLRAIGFFTNPLLLAGIAFELVFTAALVYVPPCKASSAPLPCPSTWSPSSPSSPSWSGAPTNCAACGGAPVSPRATDTRAMANFFGWLGGRGGSAPGSPLGRSAGVRTVGVSRQPGFPRRAR